MYEVDSTTYKTSKNPAVLTSFWVFASSGTSNKCLKSEKGTLRASDQVFCLSKKESAEEQDSVTLFSAPRIVRAWKMCARRG